MMGNDLSVIEDNREKIRDFIAGRDCDRHVGAVLNRTTGVGPVSHVLKEGFNLNDFGPSLWRKETQKRDGLKRGPTLLNEVQFLFDEAHLQEPLQTRIGSN